MEERGMAKRVHFPPLEEEEGEEEEDEEEEEEDEQQEEEVEFQEELDGEEERSISAESDGSRVSSAKSEEWQAATAEQHGLKSSRAASKADGALFKPAMVKLEDQMNNENLENLQKIFEEADEDGGGGLDIDEFRRAMIKAMVGKGEMPDDNQLAITFMKVDANCDGTVDWEEFCSYMLLETQLKDVMTSEDREMEFPNPAREIPSSHRDAITRITYLPKLSHGTDDPSDSNGGRYVSVSKEGTLHFWSMDLAHPQKTLSLGNEGKASKNVWITDCVVLPNAKKFALSSADREIAFYDCSANSFDKQLVICSLDYCVLTMDYWYCSAKLNEGTLLFGDSGGSVYCLKFSATTGSLIDLNIGQQIPSVSFRRVTLSELQQGKHSHIKLFQFKGLHEDWVRKVKYYPSLQSFISCATASNTSMYLGNVDRKKTNSVFRIRKGISSFDYCKEWNVIVTGGVDHYVRLWNPYVTAKATSTLKGHSSAVTHIIVNSDKGEIISAAQDKVIKIWDMRDLCCVQTIPARSLLPGPHLISSLYFSSKSNCIFVGTNQLSVIEGQREEPTEEKDISSHCKPICAAIYNDLFEQVVSACHDSVVCVWSLVTGEKVIQFSYAHGNSEITAMRFDQSKRRLITGARDGTVKIWNFNNGCCLSQLKAIDDQEITAILCYKQKIITVGWNRKVVIYRDCRDEEESEPRVWHNFHEDDILSAALYPTGLVATCGYDGVVKVWNIETGHVFCKLTDDDYNMERRPSVIPEAVKKEVSYSNAVITAVKQFREGCLMARFSDEEASKRQRSRPEIATGRSRLGSFPRKESGLFPRKDSSFPRKDSGYPRRDSNFSRKDSNFPRKDSSFPRKDSGFPRKDQEICQNKKSIQMDIDLPTEVEFEESYHDSSVDKVLFLERRENSLSTATLMTSGPHGTVRAWSVYGGGLLGYFTATQGKHDSVVSLTTDHENTILVTGDTAGFVKVWDISSYCFNPYQPKTLGMPPRKVHPANKGRTIDSNPPPLLVSFRAHLKSVVSLDFVDRFHLIITGSKDASVRLWTQTGRYIGAFGQRTLWDLEVAVKGPRRLPMDVQRIASAETLRKVANPGRKWKLARHIMRLTAMSSRGTRTIPQDQLQDTDELQEWNKTIANSLENVLGKFYKPKTRHRFLPPLPKLKFNQNQMIVYSSLQFKDLQAIVEPKTPAVLLNNATRYKSSSSLLPRIPKVGGYKTSSDSKNTTYYNTSVKQNRANNLVSQKNTSRKPHEGAMRRSSFKK
ncbi:cilia- and flagella-associated protein 337-like [Montipora capricornis]|uniref:cilia- and flagella-associated protein 337-like n=1 Tax=Montipora capricornis TaxID=246305 RepID=UPI0035F12395